MLNLWLYGASWSSHEKWYRNIDHDFLIACENFNQWLKTITCWGRLGVPLFTFFSPLCVWKFVTLLFSLLSYGAVLHFPLKRCFAIVQNQNTKKGGKTSSVHAYLCAYVRMPVYTAVSTLKMDFDLLWRVHTGFIFLLFCCSSYSNPPLPIF